MESLVPRLAWMKVDSTGMWSPAERSGWWINFARFGRDRTEVYGPFATEEETREYLRWAFEEAELNGNNEPAIVAALRATEEITLIET